MSGVGVVALFAGAFALWGLLLALIWQAFRSWQYLMDLAALPGAPEGEASGGICATMKPAGWARFTRGQQMALRAWIVLFGLPDGCPAEMHPHGRRFRRAIAGLVVLSCAVGALVAGLEPALRGALRLFYAGLCLWGLVHLAMLVRWRARAQSGAARI